MTQKSAGPLVLAVMFSTILAGGHSFVAHAIQAPRAGGQAPAMSRAQMEARFFGRIEKQLGKKLTATQKQQMRQAFQERQGGHAAVELKFRSRLGKILGITPQQMQERERQMRGGR